MSAADVSCAAPMHPYPLIRFRPGVLAGLDDMPRGVLSREIGVTVPTLHRYVIGDTMPDHHSTLNKLAELIGCSILDLIETDTGAPLNAEPCPSWCDDHHLTLDRGRVRGHVSVIGNRHQRSEGRLGPIRVSIEGHIGDRHGYPDTFIRADTGRCSEKMVLVSIGGLSVDEVSWLAVEMVRLAQVIEDASTEATQ